MAAGYIEEEEVWKCSEHPSKRKRHGICPTCLRNRLVSLCPNCGKIQPCTCSATKISSSSGRFSNTINGDSSLRRSRSVAAIPRFIRSYTPKVKTPSFLKRSSTKRNDETLYPKEGDVIGDKNDENSDRIEDFARMITRSRSVNVGTGFRQPEVSSSPSSSKGKFWNFPSPMKVFRSSKHSSKLVAQERSPLHRG